MPRTLGDSFLHVSRIHYFVEYDEPLIESFLGTERSRRTDSQIRFHTDRGRLHDSGRGSEGFQFGTAGTSKAKRDLGIHTENLTDSHLHLIRSGAVTGLRKTVNQGKIVASFCMGSRDLYDFVDNNPEVEIYPIEYVNNREADKPA